MAYKAIVELLIDVETFGEACDAVAEMLRLHLHADGSVLRDWRYQSLDGSWDNAGPVEVASITDHYNEDSPWPQEVPA